MHIYTLSYKVINNRLMNLKNIYNTLLEINVTNATQHCRENNMYKTYVDKANRIKTYTHSNFFVIFWTMLMTALNLSLFDRWTPRKTSWSRIFGKSLKWKIGESPCISKDANSFCWHRITISNFLFVSALRYYIKNNIPAIWVDCDVFWGTIKIVC